MRYMTLLLLVTLLLYSPGAPAAFQNPPETQKPLYRPSGNEATLIGSITVNGKVPAAWLIDMSADPICVDLNRAPARLERLVTNDQALLNVFVYLKSSDTLNAYRFELPEAPVVLERTNCRYLPHVLGLRVGQRLSIVNNDPTVHNAHPTPKLNREWNQTQPMGGAPLIKSFDRAEQFIPFKCNQHPWEKAYVGVFDHPFFAVSDQFGNYEIRGMPAGTYTVVAWHERLGQHEMELTVGAGERRRMDFTFDVEAKPRSRPE